MTRAHGVDTLKRTVLSHLRYRIQMLPGSFILSAIM